MRPIREWAGIAEFEYDRRANETHAFIACASFREWWTVSGKVSREDFLPIIESAVIARLDCAGLLEEVMA